MTSKVFFGVFVFLLFLEFPGTNLFYPDESRYAEIPREMMASGDFLTPTLNGSHYFEKPPLLYWLNAGAMKMFGETPYAVRLPVRIFTLATGLLLVLLAGSSAGSAGGWGAGLIYMSAPLSFLLGRINIIDAVLTFFLTLAFLCLKKLLLENPRGVARVGWEVALGMGLAGAMLAKGLIGLVFPSLTLAIWAVILKEWASLRRVVVSWATPVFLVLAVPWFWEMEKSHPGFLNYFFVHEHIERFSTKEAKRVEPFYFFFAIFVAGFLPWLGTLARALAVFAKKLKSEATLVADDLFLVIWAGLILAFFSLSQSKLIPYILPMIPPCAILVGRYLLTNRRNTWGPTVMVCFWAVVYLGLILALPTLAKDYSDDHHAILAQTIPSEHVVCYKTFSASFPWVLKRPVPVVSFQGELASDNKKSPELFWDEDAFWGNWYSEDRMLVFLRKEEWSAFQAESSIGASVMSEDRHALLVANFSLK